MPLKELGVGAVHGEDGGPKLLGFESHGESQQSQVCAEVISDIPTLVLGPDYELQVYAIVVEVPESVLEGCSRLGHGLAHQVLGQVRVVGDS